MKTIEITVEGGVIQDICNIPEGVQVRVLDYDHDGTDADKLTLDEEGNQCIESIWT